MSGQRDPQDVRPRDERRALGTLLSVTTLSFAAIAVFLTLGGYFAQVPSGTILFLTTAVLIVVSESLLGYLYPPQTPRQAVERTVLNLLALASILLPLWFLGLGGVFWGIAGLVWMKAAFQSRPDSKPLRPAVVLAGLVALAAWMFPVIWMLDARWLFFGRNSIHAFVSTVLSACFVRLVAARSNRTTSILIGAATGVTAVGVTAASWFVYYFSFASVGSVLSAAAVAIVAAAWGALAGAKTSPRVVLQDWLQIRSIRLDDKTRPLVPELGRQLFRAGAVHFERVSFTLCRARLEDEKAVPVLIEALHSPDKRIAYSAAETLGRIGPAAKQAAADLRALVGGDHVPGDRAADALARIGAEGVAFLVELLHDERETARAAAAAALRLAEDDAESATAALAAALGDPRPSVRQRAAGTLRRLGRPSEAVVRALERALSDSDPLVRVAAGSAFRELAARAAIQDH